MSDNYFFVAGSINDWIIFLEHAHYARHVKPFFFAGAEGGAQRCQQQFQFVRGSSRQARQVGKLSCHNRLVSSLMQHGL